MMTGQKVVCVNGVFPLEASQLYTSLPKEGQVYVIRDVSVGVNWNGEAGEVCLLLVGLTNPSSSKPPFPERGFNAERFRPLEEVQQRQSEPVHVSGVVNRLLEKMNPLHRREPDYVGASGA